MSEHRKIIQIAILNEGPAPFKVQIPKVMALADDGTVWSIKVDPVSRSWTYWEPLPVFPLTDEDAANQQKQWKSKKYVNPLHLFKLLFRRN